MTGGGDAEAAYSADRARALDGTGGFATNQGGTVVVAPAITTRPYGDAGANEGRLVVAEVSPTLTKSGAGVDRTGNEHTEADFLVTHVAHPTIAFSCKDHGQDAGNDLSPTLRAMHHVAGNANAGGQIAVAYPIDQQTIGRDGKAETAQADAAGRVRVRDPGLGVGGEDDPMFTLQTGKPHSVVYAAEVAGTLLSPSGDAGFRTTEIEGPGLIAVAFSMRGRDGENVCEPEPEDVAPALRTGGGGSDKAFVATAYNITPSDSNADYKAREANYAQALTGAAGKAPGARGGDVVVEQRLAFNVYPEHGQGAALRAAETDLAPALDATSLAESTDRGLRILESFAFKPSHYTRDKDGAPSAVSFPLTADADADKGDQDGVVLAVNFEHGLAPHGKIDARDVVDALTASEGKGHTAVFETAVRRLMPVECERLQGFEDGHTDIEVFGKPAADGPRYRSLGNSWATKVVEWLGGRITAAMFG